MFKHLFFVLSLFALGNACKSESKKLEPLEKGDIPTRQFTPPPGEVRSMPPHDVRGEGIGPYKIGMPIKEALSSLQGGPRIELWSADGLSEYRLVRTEGGSMVLGADRGGSIQFISVLDPSLIESPDGVVLGAQISSLLSSLNTEVSTLSVSDPSLLTLSSLPSLKLIVKDKKVVAALHVGDLVASDIEAKNCTSNTDMKNIKKQFSKLLSAKKDRSLVQGCLGKNPMWIATLKDQVAIFTLDGNKLKKTVNSYIPGLIKAGPIDINNDGRDEICFIKSKANKDEKTIDVAVAKLDGRTLQTVISRKVVKLKQTSLTHLGVDLDQSELLSEVGFKGKDLMARVILVHKENKQIRDVIPMIETKLKTKK